MMSVPPPPERKNDRATRAASLIILALSFVLGVNFAVSEVHRYRAEAAKRAQRDAMMAINQALQEKDDPAIIVGLLKRIPDAEAKKRPLLERAVYSGRLETTRALLDRGYMPDGRNGNGSPLRTAAAYGHTPMVALLLQRGANPGILSSEGRNALHWAAAAGKTDTVRVLLDAGADVNAGTGLPPSLGEDSPSFLSSVGPVAVGAPPMRPMSGEQPLPAVPILEEAYRERDVTALMFAAGNGHDETTALLLARGADPHRRTARGKTAHYYAARFGHPAVVRLLQRASMAVSGTRGAATATATAAAASRRGAARQ